MIPKVIHYCWFGRGEKSKLIQKCIKSWKKYCPDYKIIEWNEDNFDINCNEFVKQAYDAKKWAFVSDYVRLFALYNYGGVYLDTDVEIIKPIDKLLQNNGFIGFECATRVGTGVMALERDSKFADECLSFYSGKEFIENGEQYSEPNVVYITDILLGRGLVFNNDIQYIDNMTIYPKEYFCPNPYERIKNLFNKNTYTVHYLDSSWRTDKGRNDLKRALRHESRWYRTYESVKILPQKTIRFILGDKNVEKIKRRISKNV